MVHTNPKQLSVKMRFFDYKSPYLDRFGIVLIYTSALLVLLLLIDLNSSSLHPGIASVGVSIATALILTYSLRASGVNHRYSFFINIGMLFGVMMTALVAVLGVLIPGFSESLPPHSLQPLWVLVACLTPIATIYRLLQHQTVSGRTLAAAVSAYLQIAIAFTFVYLLLASYNNDSFFTSPQPSTTFMYFSIITISTVGYGDFTATNNIGHALSALEALIGQIYLVIIVALLVGLYTSNHHALTPRQKAGRLHNQHHDADEADHSSK